MTYRPFKMRSSPMKRNFGIGEREETSPGKVIPEADAVKNPVVEEEGLTRGQKVKKGVGSMIMAALDAGGGTSNLADKEATEKAKKDKKTAKTEADAKSELEHKRAIDLLMVGKEKEEEKEKPYQLTKEDIAEGRKLSSTGEPMSLIEDYEKDGIYEGENN